MTIYRTFGRVLGGVVLGLHLPAAAQARPVQFQLEKTGSIVAFATDFETGPITGSVPVADADLRLDLDRLEASTIKVSLDAAHAKASFPFAAQAMRGPSVLDTGRYPAITFESSAVKSSGKGADVMGQLTLRGVTRKVVLHATLHRQLGRAADDLDHLTVRLTGAIRRSDFGADGYAGMVGDEVRLDIRAQIARNE